MRDETEILVPANEERDSDVADYQLDGLRIEGAQTVYPFGHPG
jgi:hypothetical protein